MTATAPAAESRARPAAGGRRAPKVRPWRRLSARAALWTVTGATLAFLLVPVVVVAVFSLNSHDSLTTFGHPTLDWYRKLAGDSNLLSSVKASIGIAAATTAIAGALGTLLAFGLVRGRTRWARPTEGALLLTLVSPEVATAMSLFVLFTSISIPLSLRTVLLGHVTFSIVYVTIIVRARMADLRRDVEEAARDLGASELATLRLVVLPQLLPTLVGAGILVFVLSFDDFVTSYFMAGTGVSPLPVFIYGMIKFGVSPEINAVGTVMMGSTIVLGITGFLLVGSRRRAASPA